MWAGSMPSPEETARWHERGVKVLAWHGRDKKAKATEQGVHEAMERRMAGQPHAAGLAVDEVGLYPTPESRENVRQFLLGAHAVIMLFVTSRGKRLASESVDLGNNSC